MTTKDFWYFSEIEKRDLFISWLTLSVAFALVINPIFFNFKNLIVSLPIALVAVGTGFVFHELAHRQAARHFGFHSEYRAWYPGLIFAVGLAILTMGRFIFAAPGATYFFGNDVTKKQNGIISAAGPAVNIIIGISLLSISFIPLDAFIRNILFYSAMINFWFAFFNLLPIFILDGTKIIQWNKGVWAILIIIAGFFAFIGF
jgi:Zn-dependent protease